MRRKAVIWSGLDCEPYAPGPTLLTEPDCFCNIAGGVAGQRIM